MTRLRFVAASVVVLTLSVSDLTFAQTAAEWTAIQQLQTDIKADRQALVAQNLPLTDAEAKAFWPVYKEYRTEVERLGDRLVKVITAYAANYPDQMTDDKANAFFNEYLDIERDKLDVRNKYVPRVRRVLSGQKAARFFQIENKLDALINLGIANEIPLIPVRK